MNSSFDTYLVPFFYALGVMKLLRMELISKTLLLFFIIIFCFIGITGIVLSFVATPFLLFKASNETLDTLLKITLSIIFISVCAYCAYNYKLIFDFFTEIKEEVKNKDSKLSKVLLEDTPLNALNKYLRCIRDDIEKQLFYNLGFFILLQLILIDVYSDHHFPILGSLYDFGIFSISKLHLLWLIPLSFLLTYTYSKYYFEFISDITFEKFLALCRFFKHQREQVVIDENKNIKLIDEDSISSYFKVSDDITFVQTDDDIYHLIDDDTCYRKFRKANSYISLNGSRVFTTEYYKDYS
jgi:hypothetical protein